jgi:hypothetical protein
MPDPMPVVPDANTEPCPEPRGGRVGTNPEPLEVEPTNPFEVMIAERLQALRRDVDRLQTRLDWLFALIIGAAVTNVVLALLN